MRPEGVYRVRNGSNAGLSATRFDVINRQEMVQQLTAILSRRELQVTRMVASGMRNREIGKKLSSPKEPSRSTCTTSTKSSKWITASR